jgi:hypothetical protein
MTAAERIVYAQSIVDEFMAGNESERTARHVNATLDVVKEHPDNWNMNTLEKKLAEKYELRAEMQKLA